MMISHIFEEMEQSSISSFLTTFSLGLGLYRLL